MAEASTNNEPSTPPTMRNVRQSAKGPATDDETDTGGGSDDPGGWVGGRLYPSFFLLNNVCNELLNQLNEVQVRLLICSDLIVSISCKYGRESHPCPLYRCENCARSSVAVSSSGRGFSLVLIITPIIVILWKQ